MVKELNDDSFKEVLECKEQVLVDFYAEWCGPCKMLAPIMEELSNTYKVYKVNVDESPNLASEYNIFSIPCLLVFNNGEEINRSIGLKSKDEILEMLK